MPTGYTADAQEKQMDAKSFVLLCARDFGCCIDMRDSSLGTPIPESFPISSYHGDALRAALKEYHRWKSLSESDKLIELRKEGDRNVLRYREILVKQGEENAFYDGLIEKIEAWDSGEEFEGIKDFALDQLRISRNNTEYTERWLMEAENAPRDPEVKAKSIRRDILYHTRQSVDEVRRVSQRNKYLEGLRKAVEIL